MARDGALDLFGGGDDGDDGDAVVAVDCRDQHIIRTGALARCWSRDSRLGRRKTKWNWGAKSGRR